MRPFTALKFFIENKKKAIVSFLVLIFTVCAISLITVLINSIPETVNDINIKPLEYFSGVSMLSGETFLKDTTVSKLKENRDIEKLVEAGIDNTSVNLAIGGNTSVPVVFMKQTDVKYYLAKTKDRIREGRLPEDGKQEIIVHWRVAANKGWKLGDDIGNFVDKNEWINGKYKIVGIVEGPIILVTGTENFTKSQIIKNTGINKPIGFITFFKDGKRASVNSFIGKIDRTEANTFTYEKVDEQIKQSISGLSTTLLYIIIIVVFILSISVSSLMYIIYLQRSDEFGIIYAIGYRRGFIRNMIIKEIMSLNIVGWILGLVLSYFIVSLLNSNVYNPKGNVLSIMDVNILIYTGIIPVMVSFLSIVPIINKLRKWDPVAVIERRE